MNDYLIILFLCLWATWIRRYVAGDNRKHLNRVDHYIDTIRRLMNQKGVMLSSADEDSAAFATRVVLAVHLGNVSREDLESTSTILHSARDNLKNASEYQDGFWLRGMFVLSLVILVKIIMIGKVDQISLVLGLAMFFIVTLVVWFWMRNYRIRGICGRNCGDLVHDLTNLDPLLVKHWIDEGRLTDLLVGFEAGSWQLAISRYYREGLQEEKKYLANMQDFRAALDLLGIAVPALVVMNPLSLMA